MARHPDTSRGARWLLSAGRRPRSLAFLLEESAQLSVLFFPFSPANFILDFYKFLDSSKSKRAGTALVEESRPIWGGFPLEVRRFSLNRGILKLFASTASKWM